MAEVLNVEPREANGKRVAKRLRQSGHVPAILYGHGEQSVSLSVCAEQFSNAVRHGARVVELRGAANEKAFIRDMQWDVYGLDVLHVDFTRVSEHERIQVEVKVALRGEAPGLKNGGIVEQMIHEVEIECEALSIPEKLFLLVNSLNVGDSLNAAQVQLPEGATLITEPDTVVVHCVVPNDAEEESQAETGAEPEVIGRKAEDESDEE